MWDWFIDLLTTILGGIQGLVGDWGLAVIILTIIVRVILTPLMNHSTRSNARMQIVQPKLQELQQKYADDPIRMNEEMRKLYSEMKFNPLGGCLPIFLQMPIFFGLFAVIRNVPADASFFGILPSIAAAPATILSESGFVAALPYIIFDLLFGVLTFVPMMMNSSNNTQAPEQRQQTMIMGAVMSLMMLWFGWTVPAACLLYYVTSSLWQTIQMRFVTRKVMDEARAQAEADAAHKPVEVDVVRKEKKPRPHKKG